MTTGAFRIAGRGLEPEGSPLSFTFDGKRYVGRAGDTLASALLANGVHLVGRSFKYHRPRGILGSGTDEPNALVGVRRDAARYTPNLLATQVELYEGLDAVSQNRMPSLDRDRQAVNGLFARFLPAGFYYKTFMWPKAAWYRFYEPRIRAAAGLGIAPDQPDPDRYSQRFAHCEVLVIGAGPAGVVAALSAAISGARVILVDEGGVMGGSLLAAHDARIDGVRADVWLADRLDHLRNLPNVRLLPRTVAFGYYAHNLIGLAQRLTDHLPPDAANGPRERLWQVRANQVVLATGAIERPLVFPDNDRPGIMLAEAARVYLHRWGVAVGGRVVVVTADDHGYRVAREMRDAGIVIEAIIELRQGTIGIPMSRLEGFTVLTGARILGTDGKLRVAGITVAHAGRRRHIRCDAILMAGGFTPSVHLFSQSRGRLQWDAASQAFLPHHSAEQERSAGAARGLYDLAAALADGAEAGMAAARAAGRDALPALFPHSVEVAFRPGRGGRLATPCWENEKQAAKAFVDWQNDVTARDILLATREGFQSVEHVKRYTTNGMATDQGKLSNVNALGIMAAATGRTIPDVGLTTFRPPYTPTTFGTLAGVARGDLFDPVRITPVHGWAVERGAVFEDVGQWKRARYFPREGEDMRAAVDRECVAVRNGVGLFDASTLGKIELIGPDAATFMNRFYVNAWTKLGVGKCRYGVLLREDGFVLDDGVVGRIAQDRFHITTTTGGAARVLAMMEDYLQTEWQDLRVWATSTTEQWAVIAVQGPKARAVIAGLVEGIDLSPDAFPHMAIGDARICGVPMRLMRVSFTGELGFEVNVPSEHGRMVWEALFAAGRPHGVVPYGTETMHVLRAEKGYIIVGQETDGTVSPDDAGLGWAIGRTKPDFVGKRSLSRPAMQAPDRKQLVGLRTIDPSIVLEEGAQIASAARSSVSLGHVTSSYHSSVLGRSIALALLRGGRHRIGEELIVPMPSGPISVEVTPPIFLDPEGSRIHV